METQGSNPRAGLSTTDAAMALKQLREKQAAPEQPQIQEEVTEEPTDNQAESAEIEAEADTETEVAEVEEDQAETEVQEDAEPSDDDLYEINGLEFTLAELQEWRENGLKNKDYTQKTQALSEDRNKLATDRQQFELERSQVTEALKAEKAQLQEALAAFAIEQDPRPIPDGKSWEQYSTELAEWETRERRRGEAKQAHQALMMRQQQETLSRELNNLFLKRPEWRNEAVFAERMSEIQAVASEYGVSPEEFATWTDHRFFMALSDIHSMKQGMTTQQAKEGAASKKVVKAVKRLSSSAKPEQKAGVTKQAQEAKARARKTGRPDDALKALQAARQARRG